MSLSVLDVKNDTSLPAGFRELLPELCPDCSAPTTITPSLRTLACSNPRCPAKVTVRAVRALKQAGVLHLGNATVRSIIDQYSFTSPASFFDPALFRSGFGECVPDSRKEGIISALEEFVASPLAFWQVLQLVQVPGVSTTAQRLAVGFDSADAFFDSLKSGGSPWVASRLGLGDSSLTDSLDPSAGIDSPEYASAVLKLRDLLMFEDDVRQAVSFFPNLLTSATRPLQTLSICVSDSAGAPFSTKESFYRHCRQEFSDRFEFVFTSSVTKRDSQALVWAGADGTPANFTSKVSKVQLWNEKTLLSRKGRLIPIVTGQQLVDFLSTGAQLETLWDYAHSLNGSSLDPTHYSSPDSTPTPEGIDSESAPVFDLPFMSAPISEDSLG